MEGREGYERLKGQVRARRSRCCISAIRCFRSARSRTPTGSSRRRRRGRWSTADDLRAWMDVCLDETIGRIEGPAVWQAWAAFRDADWDTLAHAGRRAHRAAALVERRRSSRAMGLRLLTTWQALHPDARMEQALALATPRRPRERLRAGAADRVCRRVRVRGRRPAARRRSVRVHAARGDHLRGDALMPIGQTDAHALLARTLERVPAVVERDRQPRRAHRIVRAGGGHCRDDAAVCALEVIQIVKPRWTDGWTQMDTEARSMRPATES